MRKYIIAFCCVLLTVGGWAQVTRVRLKQLELAPDSLKVYLIVSDTVTKQAYWQELDSIPISGGGGSSTFYAYADAGTVQTLSPGDTIKITTGPGLSSWAMATDQVKVTLDSTGVVEGTYNFATVTVNAQGRITLITAGVEIDGSFTNEGMMGVASGGSNSATLYTNTSGNLGTSFAGGAGILVTETTSPNGGTITHTADTVGTLATQYDISGFISGSGTSGRVPRFTATRTVADGALYDDGTLLAIGGATVAGYSFYDYGTSGWRLPVGTTAQRPTAQAGAFRYNSTLGYLETYGAAAWLQSSFPAGTSGQTLRHNGSAWIANSHLYNDGTRIGVGTSAPDIGFASSTFTVKGVNASDGYGIVTSYRNVSALSNGSGFQMVLNNSSGSPVTYAYIPGIITSNTAGAHSGALTVWLANSGSITERFRFTGDGKLGVNRIPVYDLDVSGSGGIRVSTGTTAQRPTAAAGVIRFNTTISDFECHDGVSWRTFLPSGTSGQTLRHNGSAWIANSHLYNDGTRIGVGTITPISNLHVVSTGSSIRGITVSQHSNDIFSSAMFFIKSRGSELSPSTVADLDFLGGFNFRAHDGSSYLSDNAYFGAIVSGSVSAGNIPASIYFISGPTTSYSPDFLLHSSGNIGVGSSGNGSLLTTITTPARQLTVYGEARVTDLNTDPPSIIVGADLDGDLSAITIGSGLNLSPGGTLTATGTMSSWTLAGTSGTPQLVSNSETATVAAGFGMTTTAGATRTVTVAVDTVKIPTMYDLSQIETIYTGDGTINETRTVTLDDAAGSFNLWWDDGAGNTREFTVGPNAATYTGEDGLWYADYSGVTAAELKVSSADAQAYIAVAVGASQSTIEVESSEVTVTTATATTDLTASGAANWKVSGTTKMTFINPGRLGINDTSPEELLDVAGNAKFQKIIGQDNTPTIATNANAGTGRSAAVTSSQSSDVAGRFYVTTGTGLTAGEWAVVSFGGSAFTNTPVVMLQAENANAASLAQYLYVVPTTTGFSVSVNSSAVGFESLTFEFGYHVIGGK